MPAATSQVVSQLQRSIARAIYGKEDAIQLALITLLARGLDAQRKRRQGQLFIFKFHHGANRLAGKNMFRQHEPHSDARERDGRENTGHQNEGDEASENQEEEIVAGVERRERDKNDPAEINPTLKGDAVFHFVSDPAERRALRENRDERHAHPAGDGQRGKRRSAGERELTYFRGGAGIQR